MNTKKYQKIDVDIPYLEKGKETGEKTVSVSQLLDSSHKYATGLFFYSKGKVDGITVSLKIDGREILPLGTDLPLFCYKDGLSRNELLWKFYTEGIESANKRLEATFTNTLESATKGDSLRMSIYVLLENEPGKNDE